ncbi:MAG: acyl-CoA thioesterase [Acidobacteria bacterium]|nr:MAG: acyl-CoA thioesterase [Acidobacteriota bacterium]
MKGGGVEHFVTRRQVEFADTDSGGVVHFSRYLIFMETAEHQFLASRGIDVDTRIQGKRVSWPRVSARCSYSRPLVFGDQIQIEVTVVRCGRTSMTYAFVLRRGDEEVACGEMTSVCCVIEPDGRFTAIPIPEELSVRLDGGGSGS